jgi:hypothetical protein
VYGIVDDMLASKDDLLMKYARNKEGMEKLI